MNIYKSFFGNNQSNAFENNLTQSMENENDNSKINDTTKNQNISNSLMIFEIILYGEKKGKIVLATIAPVIPQ